MMIMYTHNNNLRYIISTHGCNNYNNVIIIKGIQHVLHTMSVLYTESAVHITVIMTSSCVSVLQFSVEVTASLQWSSKERGLTFDLLRDEEQLVLWSRQSLHNLSKLRTSTLVSVPGKQEAGGSQFSFTIHYTIYGRTIIL